MSHRFLVPCSHVLHSSFLQLFVTGRAEILWLELPKDKVCNSLISVGLGTLGSVWNV